MNSSDPFQNEFSFQKNPSLKKQILSPVPLRKNYFCLNRAKCLSRSADSLSESHSVVLSILHKDTNSFKFTPLLLQPENRTSSNINSEKNSSILDSNDLNNLLLLRQDSQNPQEKDDCFKCIKFDNLEILDVPSIDEKEGKDLF